MTVKLSPILNEQQFDANGDPLVGGKIYTYAAGSSTPQTSFTAEDGLTPQANPIILNARGEVDNPIWLTAGLSYKLVLTDVDDVVIRTIDDVTGVNDSSVALDQWVDSGVSPTYVNATQFTLSGDQTNAFQVNRRVKCTVTGGTVYGYISVSAFAALTTITVVLDSGTLDSGLSAVQLGLITPVNTSLFQMQTGNIADDAVTTAKIADSAVTLAKLANEARTNKIQPITASVGSNALTITLNPTTLDFRDATLGSGAVNTRDIPSAISVVVSSGSTLGTVNAVQNRLAVLAIDNAGTVELAVVNLSGGANLDETGVISTTAEGGAGAADSASVVYSTTARTNVPYRVVGFVESTQATAGTWATAPSKIQGYGGQAFAANSSIGYGQTWNFVTGSRSFGTTYYNTTGKPIMVVISANNTSNSNFNIAVGGAFAASVALIANQSAISQTVIVPPGMSYIASMTAGTPANISWSELR